jgi:hypothetical protein
MVLPKLGEDRKRFCALRAVCRQLRCTTEPLFHSDFILFVDNHRLDIAKSQLEDLATRRTQACEFVRKLKIVRLAPSYDSETGTIPDPTKPKKRVVDGPELELAIQHMRKYLTPAIASLKNLRHIV